MHIRERGVTKYCKVTHTVLRLTYRQIAREKNRFYFANSCPFRFCAQNVSHLDIMRDTPLHCTVRIYMKMFIAHMDIKYFYKVFMGGKQIDISFVENNSSHRTITSRILWRLFKIVIYLLNYQVEIFC